MLHVTNGDSAGAVLRAAGFEGDVLCWRDVLHEGPVPQGSEDDLRRARARFLSGYDGADDERLLRDLSERDARLVQAVPGEDIVLWFEHDLYDQLQLLQILVQLADAGADWSRVALVCDAEYLGPSTPERLRERFPGRAAVAAAAVDLAQRAWAAFRAPDPTALVALLNDDCSPLPFVGPALRRHLQQFPSTFNGLSRSEHQALDAIAAGASLVRDAFVRSHQQREDPVFLGDLVFLDYLRDLAGEPSPLVEIGPAPNPLDATVSLTPAGEAVLRGEADRVERDGIDRWLGGVHLQGRDVWRWDGASIVTLT